MNAIKRRYARYYGSLFGFQWDTRFHRLLDLCEYYEGLVPVFVPLLQNIMVRDRAVVRTVYYLADYDFQTEEVVCVYRFRAPRKGNEANPRPADLRGPEYLRWEEIPKPLLQNIQANIGHQRRVELEELGPSPPTGLPPNFHIRSG